MTENELFEALRIWENQELVFNEISENPEHFKTLMNLALNNTEQRSWRAAYLAEKIHDQNPEMLRPYIAAITKRLKTEKNASKRRHWLKLISLNEIDEKEMGLLLDYCIGIFTSGSEAIAVRVHAMQILYNISEKEPELKPEVLQIIEQELELHPTAGIRSRGKKLAVKLRKEIKTGNS